jgi:hypothetical protein
MERREIWTIGRMKLKWKFGDLARHRISLILTRLDGRKEIMQPPTEKYGMFFLGQFMWYGIAISKD